MRKNIVFLFVYFKIQILFGQSERLTFKVSPYYFLAEANSETLKPIPFAKIIIKVLETNKSYIGFSDKNGLVKNMIFDNFEKDITLVSTVIIEGFHQNPIYQTKIESPINAAVLFIKKIKIDSVGNPKFEEKKPMDIVTNRLVKSNEEKVEIKQEPIISEKTEKSKIVKNDIVLPVKKVNEEKVEIKQEPIISKKTEKLNSVKNDIVLPVKKVNEEKVEIKQEPIISKKTEKLNSVKNDIVVTVEKSAIKRDGHLFLFLVDISESMDKPFRIGLLKYVLDSFFRNLQPNDQVSIITFNYSTNTILPITAASESSLIIQKIKDIQPLGGTKGISSILNAYDYIKPHCKGVNKCHVIIATDGLIYQNREEEDTLYNLIYKYFEEGIRFDVMGFNISQQYLLKMNRLVRAGGGTIFNFNATKRDQHLFFIDQLTK
jgi:Mg-chelatase subunit ChlD